MGRIAERNYDIFIAYHGTYDSNGSCSEAEQLCDFLESKGYNVFFFHDILEMPIRRIIWR